ncbi:hypothetical protein D3C73_1235770 [compost metagenome]
MVWLAKELLITNDGWPVALPRLSNLPSDSTMMDRSEAVPASKTHSWTCGLISTFLTPAILASPAMSISLSKWPMFPTIALFFMPSMCSAMMTSLLPVVVMKMSPWASTVSSLAT